MPQPRNRVVIRLIVCLAMSIVMFPAVSSAQLFTAQFGVDAIESINEQTGQVRDFAGFGDGFITGLTFGPDGGLYVSGDAGVVGRFDGATGAFLDYFALVGLGARALAFGPDGNLYVVSGGIQRYDGRTGAFLNVFAPPGSGGLGTTFAMRFGPDGNLYVANRTNSNILRYNGQTGAFLDAFVPSGSGGLNDPRGFVFGPDGHLYVSSFLTHEILEYDGQTGAFLHAHITSGEGGLLQPTGLVFGPEGNLYVGSNSGSGQILRYDGPTGTFLGVLASGVGGQFMTFRPVRCDLVTQDTYLIGQAVTVGVHIANGLTAAAPVEAKLWLYAPTVALNLVKGTSTDTLPPGYNQTTTFTLRLSNVGPTVPRGSYRMGCRLLNPVTGGSFGESLRSFTVQ